MPVSEATRGYRLTRNFAVGALVVICLAAAALTTFNRDVAVDQLQRMAEQNNSTLTQAVANGLWPRFASFIAASPRQTPDAIKAHPTTAQLARQVRELMAETRVLKVKLYALSGYTAFSTESGQIGSDYSDNPRFLQSKAGGTASKLEFRESFNSMNGPVRDRWVLSSYVPVRPGGSAGAIEGVAEIYSDVTDLHAQMRRTELVQIAVGGVTFLIVFALLLAMVYYADRQIRRHHRENLRLAANMARVEAASNAKSDFLANMSHELRTPLNAIIGFSEMIKDATLGPVGNPSYVTYASDIHGAGQHLLKIINDVLDLVKIESGQMSIMIDRVDLHDVIEGIIKLLRAKAAEANVALVFDGAGTTEMVDTDEVKLQQILINLVANGIKFTPAGGTVRLAVAQDPSQELTQIIVEDTGIGIAADDIAVALAPFSQVDASRARQFEGTGLGLPLSKRLAQRLGGDLFLDSTPGQGSTVTVTLPTHRQEDDAAPLMSAA